MKELIDKRIALMKQMSELDSQIKALFEYEGMPAYTDDMPPGRLEEIDRLWWGFRTTDNRCWPEVFITEDKDESHPFWQEASDNFCYSLCKEFISFYLLEGGDNRPGYFVLRTDRCLTKLPTDKDRS